MSVHAPCLPVNVNVLIVSGMCVAFSVGGVLLPRCCSVAIRPVLAGEYLLSWGLPFGRATKDILPGQYCCNASIIESLAVRKVDFELPAVGNFEDVIHKYTFDEASFVPATQVRARPRPALTDTRMGIPMRLAGGRGPSQSALRLLTFLAMAGRRCPDSQPTPCSFKGSVDPQVAALALETSSSCWD